MIKLFLLLDAIEVRELENEQKCTILVLEKDNLDLDILDRHH